MINVLPMLIEKFPDIHYHIVGMDSNAVYLRDLISTLKLENNITITAVCWENGISKGI